MQPISENSQTPASPENSENLEDIIGIKHMEDEARESPVDPNVIQYMEPQDTQDAQEPQEREEPHEEPVTSIDHDIASSSQFRNAADNRLHGTRRSSAMRPTRRARSTIMKLEMGTQTEYMRQQITGQLRAVLRNNPTGQGIGRLTQNSFNAFGSFWLQMWNVLWKR